MKKKSKFSFVKLFLFLTVTTISAKAIGYFRTQEDALTTAWGMPLERHLSLLSETGKLDEKHTPWSDFSWPTAQGSIANRWTIGESKPLEYRILTLRELQRMGEDERREKVKTLSPAEKLDVVRMQFSYPLLTKVRGELHRAGEDSEANLEIGWAIAATHLLEPQETRVEVKIPQLRDPSRWTSLVVPFASSDVKALLAYYFGSQALGRVKRYQVGANCSGLQSPSCASIDPASFHVLLTNMISKMGRSFVIDVDPGAKAVHRPVVAYESDIRYQSEGHYRVSTKVEVSRLRAPDWRPHDFFNLDTEALFYEYSLEVNTRGEIVRGQWVNGTKPEFAWRSDLPAVEKDFRALAEQIYQPVKKTRDLSAIRNFFE